MKFFVLVVLLIAAFSCVALAETDSVCGTSNLLDNLKSTCHESCDSLNKEACSESLNEFDLYMKENPHCECDVECMQVVELGYSRRLECLEDEASQVNVDEDQEEEEEEEEEEEDFDEEEEDEE